MGLHGMDHMVSDSGIFEDEKIDRRPQRSRSVDDGALRVVASAFGSGAAQQSASCNDNLPARSGGRRIYCVNAKRSALLPEGAGWPDNSRRSSWRTRSLDRWCSCFDAHATSRAHATREESVSSDSVVPKKVVKNLLGTACSPCSPTVVDVVVPREEERVEREEESVVSKKAWSLKYYLSDSVVVAAHAAHMAVLEEASRLGYRLFGRKKGDEDESGCGRMVFVPPRRALQKLTERGLKKFTAAENEMSTTPPWLHFQHEPNHLPLTSVKVWKDNDGAVAVTVENAPEPHFVPALETRFCELRRLAHMKISEARTRQAEASSRGPAGARPALSKSTTKMSPRPAANARTAPTWWITTAPVVILCVGAVHFSGGRSFIW